MKRTLLICFLLIGLGNLWGQSHRLHQEDDIYFIFLVPTTSQKLVDFSSENKVPPYLLAALNRREVSDSIYAKKTIKLPILPSNLIKQANTNESTLVPVVARAEDMETLHDLQHQLQLSNFLLVNLNQVTTPEELLNKTIIIGYILSPKNSEDRQSPSITYNNRTGENKTFMVDDHTKFNQNDHMLNEDLNHRIRDSIQSSVVLKDSLDLEERPSDFGLMFEKEAAYSSVLNENGAAVFYKSRANSKYIYALYNHAPVGSIVKIKNPSNDKFVYAKIIGKLPPINQYRNAIIGISGNAASALDAKDFRLFVQTYYMP